MIYPWQYSDWNNLQKLRPRWPNVLLLVGQYGIGKLDFAQHLAQSFLCESPKLNGEPCNHCLSCIWFKNGNHLDYRIVMPEALLANTNSRIDSKDGKKICTPSKEIKIDQVRALLDFCSITSHRGGVRVVVIYPAETMNIIASNAMLKTLEEPQKDVIFILVSTRIDQLLPTIISRCQKWTMSMPLIDTASVWLSSQDVNDAHALLNQAGGAPLLALAFANDKNQSLRDFALGQLAEGASCDPFTCAENLQKLPMHLVLGWLQRWLYDLFAQRMTRTLRYFPKYTIAIARCAETIDINKLSRFIKKVTRQRTIENHPLNTRLVFEEMFFNYRNLFIQSTR
ncbi:MAG: DNA polymerase III subunit delta' [Burkholderia sp.]|nr:DNA polymerase III subunit delta' [Burkholderia sp.]